MKPLLTAAIAALAVSANAQTAAPTSAAPMAAPPVPVERVYTDGPVWMISQLDVKPGMFNAFMKYHRDVVVPRYELGKRDGRVIDYRMVRVEARREGEPDALFIAQYRNMAAFDADQAYFDSIDKRLNATPASRAADGARQRDLVTTLGSMMTRELVLTR